MNLGIITKPNAKGQIVIPKKIRDKLGIDENVYINMVVDRLGVYLYPIRTIADEADKRRYLTEILDATRGSWVGDDWPETVRKRKRIELKASKKRKAAW